MFRPVFHPHPWRGFLTAIPGVCVLICPSRTGWTQPSKPDPIRRDPSFNPQSAFLKEKKHFPDIEPVTLQTPESVVCRSNVVCSILKDTPSTARRCKS